ncbi:hypothetical protein QQS21_004616 [Conoideocrella luteorostrata]|uniref:Heterokaryon incompatibility domain-containing protein n=1 Tax=Conoideocrella luteorostrata TaxID=1105319 RepID=A0AAJ0CR07_9HYPO|nr:hypothetical protein QQS21_004616 [Conoideocrella luteorostrata]
MSKPNVYSYVPLVDASAQIRILKLDFDVKAITRHKIRRPLAGTLKNYYLPKSALSRTQRALQSVQLPSFYALSYVWGPQARTHQILIDGKSLKVTENLYFALRDMQMQHMGNLYVWADAICINQDDLAERSEQVLLMREIYHSAYFVQIWLGLTCADGKRCLKFIADLCGQMYDDDTPDEESEERIHQAISFPAAALLNVGQKLAQGLYAGMDIFIPRARDDGAKLVLETDEHQKTIDSLTKWRPKEKRLKKVESENFAEMAALIDTVFIQRSGWFERMWVVQELGVTENADIIYDGTTISWDEFLGVIYYLHYTCGSPLPNIHKLTTLEKIRVGWTGGNRLPLYSLIRECRDRQASDPKDKVYALFGLMGDQMNAFLQPNYAKSLGEVYALTTQHFISQNRSLDPICGWQTSGRHDLPSWVPDYSLDQSRAAASLVADYGKESLFASSGYDIQGEYVINASPLQDWSFLHVTALFIDSIAVTSPGCPLNAELETIEQLWHTTILKAAYLLKENVKDLTSSLNTVSAAVSRYSKYWEIAKSLPVAPSLYSLEEVKLADAINQCTDLELETSSSGNKEIVELYVQSLLCGRGITTARLSGEDAKVIIDLKFPETLNDLQNNHLLLICQAFERGMRNRIIAVTNKGHICVLPQHARQGDIMCVLFGCSVPILIRKSDNPKAYTFVGDCYCYGFMDAEAIVMQIKGELVQQSIVLA